MKYNERHVMRKKNKSLLQSWKKMIEIKNEIGREI